MKTFQFVSSILLIVSFILVGSSLVAQSEIFKITYHNLQAHKTELQLSAEQLLALKTLNENYKQATQQLFDATQPKENVEPEFIQLQSAYNKSMEAILSPAQLTEYQVLVTQREEDLKWQIKENEKKEYRYGVWEGLELTNAQIELLILKEEGLQNELHNNSQNFLERKAAIEKEVLTAAQYTQLEEARYQLKRERANRDLKEMDKYIPPSIMALQKIKKEFYPRYQLLRTKIEHRISAPDRIQINAYRKQFDESFIKLKEEAREEARKNYNFSDIMERVEEISSLVSDYGHLHLNANFLMFPFDDEYYGFDKAEILRLGKTYQSVKNSIDQPLQKIRKAEQEAIKKVFAEYLSENETKDFLSAIYEFHHSPFGGKGIEWDAANTFMFLLIEPLEKDLHSSSKTDDRYRIYPSPSAGPHVLELDLAYDSPVVIELMDNSGKVLEVLFDGDLYQGINTMTYNWSHLDGTLFYYRISSREGVRTVKFIKHE